MVDDDVEDTLKYHFKNTFIFRPDKTLPLTGDEIITMPHPCNHICLILFTSDFSCLFVTGFITDFFHID